MTMAMMKTESPLARQTEAASCSQSQCGLLETEFFSYCASVLKQMCPKTRWDARDFFLLLSDDLSFKVILTDYSNSKATPTDYLNSKATPNKDKAFATDAHSISSEQAGQHYPAHTYAGIGKAKGNRRSH